MFEVELHDRPKHSQRYISLLLLGAILVFGAELRFDRLWENGLNYDECIWANIGSNFINEGNIVRNLLYPKLFTEHPPFWWLSTGVSIRLLGQNKFGLRFPSLLLGMLLIVLIYAMILEIGMLNGQTGYSGALLGALLIAMNPVLVFFSRTGQIEQGVLFWGVFALFLLMKGIRKGGWYLFFSGFFLIIGITVKYHAFFYIMVAVTILLRESIIIIQRRWRDSMCWIAGVLAGFIAAGILIVAIYSLDNTREFIASSLFFPLKRVLQGTAETEVWRSFDFKEYLDRFYGWFHPVPLLSLLCLVGSFLEFMVRKMKKRTKNNGIAAYFFWSSLIWLLILTFSSKVSRSIFYSSLCIPLLVVFIGGQIQRMISYFPNCDDKSSLLKWLVRIGESRKLSKRLCLIYGPGIIVMMFLTFLHSSYHFGNAMFSHQLVIKSDDGDPNEIIGQFIGSRYGNLDSFICTRNGPQLSYVSGKQYEQLYSIKTMKQFHSLIDDISLYIENGVTRYFENDEYIQNYLDCNFRKQYIYRFVPCYERIKTE